MTNIDTGERLRLAREDAYWRDRKNYNNWDEWTRTISCMAAYDLQPPPPEDEV